MIMLGGRLGLLCDCAPSFNPLEFFENSFIPGGRVETGR